MRLEDGRGVDWLSYKRVEKDYKWKIKYKWIEYMEKWHKEEGNFKVDYKYRVSKVCKILWRVCRFSTSLQGENTVSAVECENLLQMAWNGVKW